MFVFSMTWRIKVCVETITLTQETRARQYFMIYSFQLVGVACIFLFLHVRCPNLDKLKYILTGRVDMLYMGLIRVTLDESLI